MYEVGTATMMVAKTAVKPVGEVMQQAKVKFDPKAYIPAVAGYYTAPNGQMLSFPFNSSTTIFYYNKDKFKAAGLDPEKAPATWPEVVAAAAKLKANGEVPFTTSWISWTQLELLDLAQHPVCHQEQRLWRHRLPPGIQFAAASAPLREPGQHVQAGPVHLYKGRANAADVSFPSGECAMITGSSGLYARVSKGSQVCLRHQPAALLPPTSRGAQNTIIGGASLWVMSGKKPAEYKGVADFFAFLSQPEVQSASHKRTGYLPITLAAFEMTEKSGFYKENPVPMWR